jgi:PKD repeat protein
MTLGALTGCPPDDDGGGSAASLQADAGNDRTVEVGETVCLSASSTSSKYGVKSYKWDFDAADGISTDAAGEKVSVVYDAPDTYTVTLTVTDNRSNTDTDTCTITVEPNPAPVCVITAPKENLLLSGPVKVTGTAWDDREVVLVEVRVNTGDWEPAESADGFATWELDVDIPMTFDDFTGRDYRQMPLIKARAHDLSGNTSPEAAINRDFANAVISYVPAPGQFVNNRLYNNPEAVLGLPVSGNDPETPDTTKLATLGRFGGSLTVRFYEGITNSENNTLGMDFIVFGNPFALAGGDTHWQEPGYVEVSADENGNDEADDKWYLVPGSHLNFPYPRESRTYTAAMSHYPQTAHFPDFPPSVILDAYRLPDIIGGLSSVPTTGYADTSPVVPGSKRSFNVPDDPNTPGIDEGSGGGDAIDLTWAVDPTTGEAADLERIDFIRITNGIDKIDGTFGEVSPEIGGFGRVSESGGGVE